MKRRVGAPQPIRSRVVATLACAGLSLSGCLPPPVFVPLIPAVDQYAPDPDVVREATTRSDVLMALGCPDARHRDDRYLVYGWFQIHVFGMWIGTTGAVVWDSHRLILGFAPDGRLLERAEVSAMTARRADAKVQRWIEAAVGDGS